MLKMKIPKEITIGKKKYKIQLARFVDFFNSGVHGNINYSDGILKIKDTGDERNTEDLFFHELAHGILKELEFNYPKVAWLRNDEVFTQELGLLLRKSFLELLEKQKTGKKMTTSSDT